MQPTLIIVTGPPASGKTTLAARLAADLHLPVLHRDRLKEILFDTLGWSDRAWSRQLGTASVRLLHYALELLLQTGHPCIVESNFPPAIASDELEALTRRYGYTPAQIVCTADPEVLLARFRQRATSGERHPGHADPGTATLRVAQGSAAQSVTQGSAISSVAQGIPTPGVGITELTPSQIQEASRPLALPGPVIELDLTDPARLDYAALLVQLRNILGGQE